MKRILASLLLAAFASVAAFAQNEPKADEQAVVVSGNARFTVLTPRLIRMEWAENAVFEDRASFAVVNRKLDVPAFKVRKTPKGVVIKTSDLTLTYSGKNAKFDEKNLSVVFTMNGKKTTWHPGMDDSANLMGTIRTLDGCEGFGHPGYAKSKDVFDKGVASRDGWAIVDESNRHLFQKVDSDWDNWVEARDNTDRQDLYFFGYGHDYMGAVSDYMKIAGNIPLPPKYAFGYWWCRYWEYSDHELVDLAEHFKSYNIPIDVMIIDMDWHETWAKLKPTGKERDEFGERIGWTGYTWKKELFPNPANLLEQLHRYGVKTSLNLHFQNGIQTYEEPYERFVKDYLSRTDDYVGPKNYVKEDGSPAPVPYRMSQMAWADAYFNSVLHPFEKMGVDFWWMDWQQWKESRHVPGLSNTFWLDYVFFQDKVRGTASMGKQAPRAMIYHRWGGLGSHRYQVGFSGDTFAIWDVLRYLPWFTATASNVGYGYWGHDIGGHMQPKGVNYTNPELYTRWMQQGVFTPVYKTHSTKDMSMEKRFWVFPEHFDAMRAAIRLRYDLSPYIYTAAREAFDTGISMCRPLYYYWPEAQEAYDMKEEFMFGSDILATVVCKPVDETTGLAQRDMWFPAGSDWYDVSTGTTYKGGSSASLKYTINENPYFVKSGAIIPMAAHDITNLQHQNPAIELLVAPGMGTSPARIYEDDGNTQAYDTEYAVTEIQKTADANSVVIKVAPRKGSFKGMLSQRKFAVRLEGVYAPSKVLVNGREVKYNRFAQASDNSSEWTYDGYGVAAVIYTELTSADAELTIEYQFAPEQATKAELINGKKGLINRVTALMPEAKFMIATYAVKGHQLPSSLLNIAQCGSYITENPAKMPEFLAAMDVDAMVAEMNGFEKIPAGFKTKLEAQSRN